MTKEEKVAEILAEIERVYAILEKKRDAYWEDWKEKTLAGNEPVFNHNDCEKALEPEASMLDQLSRDKRMIISYELEPITEDTIGHLMPLSEWIDCVREGGFIDYDGYGYYCIGNQKSNVVVYPSDLKYQSIRSGFDGVLWLNR